MIFQDKHQHGKRDRGLNMGKLVPFMLSSLFIATIFGLFLLYSPNPFTIISKQGVDSVLKQQQQQQRAKQGLDDSVQKHPPTPMQGHDQSVQEEQQLPDHLKPQKSKFQNNPFFPHIMLKQVLGSN